VVYWVTSAGPASQRGYYGPAAAFVVQNANNLSPAVWAPGGKGQVWVNTGSNVYHCPGTRWYGKTKRGAYMSEAEAKGQGARPDHGKPCGS
jgi:hypothetical protein